MPLADRERERIEALSRARATGGDDDVSPGHIASIALQIGLAQIEREHGIHKPGFRWPRIAEDGLVIDHGSLFDADDLPLLEAPKVPVPRASGLLVAAPLSRKLGPQRLYRIKGSGDLVILHRDVPRDGRFSVADLPREGRLTVYAEDLRQLVSARLVVPASGHFAGGAA